MPEALRPLFCLFFVLAVLPASAGPLSIRDVHVAPPFFNPSLQQVATLSFTLASAAETTVIVLDRDGAPVRTLLNRSRFAAGPHSVRRTFQQPMQ
jgi:hypothetical protein